MLEVQIKALAEAVTANTDAINKLTEALTNKEAPKAEAPKAEAPKAEAPKAEAPKAEAPKAEAPKAEASKAEAPKTEAPKTEADEVTADVLKELAKDKIADGVPRRAIKDLITKAGADTLSGLTAEQRQALYSKMQALEGEK